jgi:hypothetical protein
MTVEYFMMLSLTGVQAYIKMDLREKDGMVWIGSIWLMIGTSGGLL